ncbi:peptide ligase PGM1-related protein [Streptomyces sp. N2-109]|uniref:Peptide ligase PGM1-related protein n=1 Tax=Streptomyces gossypii TaxID=2883101 RepID=A0ABT2JXH5_9ACTN|nr:peptide ligase PGM1-related protein [Streptomyces gossypii]MCT2591969.1 peptide ligase PGM1-related protein [Streptomyces gossypii]
MITEHEGPGALVIFANFVSPLAIDLREESVLRQWSEQAPRKLWLTRSGDVVITPVPLSVAFRRYVFHRLGIPEGSVAVITVPDTPHLPMAEALAEHRLLEPLRALVRERPGARLLPTALDEASVALAASLRIPVVPYEAGVPHPGTLRAVADMNTKSGFRAVARLLGLRLPHGRACTGAELGQVTGALLAAHERVVVKPDRSAGGHGLYFVTRGDRPAQPAPPPDSRWVVEGYVDHTRAVSAQGHATAARAEVAYDGEMRMSNCSFAGYRSPPRDLPDPARRELTCWTRALGGHLAAEGYRGPYSLDSVCTRDGTLYALECNVRRTATTTAHALVSRLARTGHPTPAWSTGTATAASPLSFDTAVARLAEAGLDFQPGDADGVLLYADRPVNGSGWRYTALAPHHTRLAELEVRLAAALGHEGP